MSRPRPRPLRDELLVSAGPGLSKEGDDFLDLPAAIADASADGGCRGHTARQVERANVPAMFDLGLGLGHGADRPP
jgi:hypothetical protein